MKELRTKKGNHVIKYYDSIEMPIVRYQRFNQAMVIAGVGTDVEGIMSKIGTIMQHVKDNRTNAAMVELKNLSLSYSMIAQGIDPKTEAFAVLVSEIDGERCDDITDDGIKATAKRIAEYVSVEERDKANEAVKKK